jgi:hypothetical protein
MATLILTAAGAALGGVFGTVGAVVGQAVGAIAGSLIDQALFGTTQEVGRITDLDVQTSTEGVPIPRVFGRVRIAGQVIWATRFEEEAEKSGGKGLGPKVRTYRYFANVAIGLCEGPIAHIGRVWANGELLDTTGLIMRVHRGRESTQPDSLILAKEGVAPAYRGTATVVFEHLPLRDYGNALPQFTFEVLRPVGKLEKKVRAVTLIPGATEYGYAQKEVQRLLGEGEAETENRHAPQATSDAEAALDELQAVCPNLERVAVVVSWFGSSLDCAACTVRPKVEYQVKETTEAWSVAGVSRGQAPEVSRVAGKVAYGGSPSDASVVALIKALKKRGLAVTFYPFVMMDVPPGNSLDDPYGGAKQAAFPWRGRITVNPAPGLAGSPDRTAAAAGAVAAFVGMAQPSHYSWGGGTVSYSGPTEWTLRRMILHYAALCKAAGGVDDFLIGSEFRGLSQVRRESRRHPFVEALVDLAEDVRGMLGAATKISYAADWSEFFGYQPTDGSGDVAFHLDPLWAHPDIDYVGIDAYWPLSDWRDGDHVDRSLSAGPADRAYLESNVAGGEHFDWYYASNADRRNNVRSPITDGAAGKPWVFRPKDLVGWWTNRHYNRPNGVESSTPTAWLAGMKPIRFTELGCPAADFGPNQPNVFPDRLSSEGASPWFSQGRRDDAAQRRYLETLLDWFDPNASGFQEARNPRLVAGGPRMVQWDRSHLWTFDARPYPFFPLAEDVWSDGPNWATGHWLNGRLGAAPLAETIDALIGDDRLGTLNTRALSPVVDGLSIADRSSARSVIDALAGLFRFVAAETATGLRFSDRDGRAALTVGRDGLVIADDGPALEIRRAEAVAVPTEVAVTFLDTEAEGRQTTVTARRDGPVRALELALPVSSARPVIAGAADAVLKDLEDGRERFVFTLPPTLPGLEAGDVVALDIGDRIASVLVERIEDTGARRIEGRAVDPHLIGRSVSTASPKRRARRAKVTAKPFALVLDVAVPGDEAGAHHPLVAVVSKPWPGTVSASLASGDGFIAAGGVTRAATLGTLLDPLRPGPVWVLDRGASVDVSLPDGVLSAISEAALLAGGNLAAVGSEAAGFELIQFRDAELIGPGSYRIGGMLRGQGGTEHLAAIGHPAGARFVLIDGALGRLALDQASLGTEQTLRIGPADRDLGDISMLEKTVIPAGAGLIPLSPVRLTARRLDNGDVAISWIRRTRVGGDRFEAYEVPLGEAFEAYDVTIRDGATVKRRITIAAPAALYSAAEQLADFGAPPTALDIAVRQISETVGPGRETRRTIDV